jgi:hypothetical protein
MADRKSNRRKKLENPIPEGMATEKNLQVPKEEKRKIYPASIVSINWDALNTKRKISEELKIEISELYTDVQKKPSAQIDRLKQLIEEYPDVQIFSAYLLMAYILEEDEKAGEIAKSLYNKYPDYMFGKIGFIEAAIIGQDLDSIPKFLDNKFNYKDLFPQKGAFHILEILLFYFSIGRYYAFKNQPEQAKEYLKEIKSIDEDQVLLKKLQNDIDKGAGVKFYQKVLRKFKSKES